MTSCLMILNYSGSIIHLGAKWNEAPDNSEVGVIRITQSK
jgi:hypothetical protein